MTNGNPWTRGRAATAFFIFCLATSALANSGGLEPAAVLALDSGTPCIVYVREGTPVRSMLAVIRSDPGNPGDPGAWADALPQWHKRSRWEQPQRIWQYAVTERSGDPAHQSEILGWLIGRDILPPPGGNASPAVLLFEVSAKDFRQLASFYDLEAYRANFHIPEGFRLEPRPFRAGARKLDAAGEFNGRLAILLKGPPHGTLEAGAYLLQAAQIAQKMLPGRIARLRVEPDGLSLAIAEGGPRPGPDAPRRSAEEIDAWVAGTLDLAWDAIASTPGAEELDRWRDRVLLQRRLSFEIPGTRLDFIARRLVAAEPEAIFAEESALASVTPSDWRATARAWLAKPEFEVWLPSRSRAPGEPREPELFVESRRFYQFVHLRVPEGELSSACVLLGLPGAPEGQWTVRGRDWLGRWREVREAMPTATREETALMWRMLAVNAIRSRPGAAARTAIALPSPLPGAGGADPYASNQYSSIVLQASSEHLPGLLDLAATFLDGGPPSGAGTTLALLELEQGLTAERRKAHADSVRDQARLLAGTSAEAVFAKRLASMEAFSERLDWTAPFDTLVNPGNMIIAVASPAHHESVSDYLDLRLEKTLAPLGRIDHMAPRRSAAWPRPAISPFESPLPMRKRFWATFEAGPDDHAAAMLLAAAAGGAARVSDGGEWTFAALEFEGFLVLYGSAPGEWIAETERSRDLGALRRAFQAIAGAPEASLVPALERLKEQALDSRANRDGGSGHRAHSLARNLFLHGDPLYSGRVDAALEALSAADVQRLAGEAAAQAEP